CAHLAIEDGIVIVRYLDGAEVTLALQQELSDAFRTITQNEKHPFLIESDGAFWVDSAARAYSREIEASQPFIAVAVFAPSLGFKLMSDFYGRVFKPAIPYKVFRKRDDAIAWLNSF
ncbi:MAG: hypothetical protein ACRCYO_09660, partial [Bacteroidia bacterium]